MTDFKEKMLLYRVQTKKDPEAYAELYDMYIERIYRFIFFKVSAKEEAEDLAGDVFLKVWNYLCDSSTKEVKNFRALVYKSARNRIVDFYREKAHRQECPLDEVIHKGEYDIGLVQVETDHEMVLVLKALKKMKQEYHDIILLKYVEEMSTSEIADALGKTNTSVRVTLHRAMKVLKNVMAQDE